MQIDPLGQFHRSVQRIIFSITWRIKVGMENDGNRQKFRGETRKLILPIINIRASILELIIFEKKTT